MNEGDEACIGISTKGVEAYSRTIVIERGISCVGGLEEAVDVAFSKICGCWRGESLCLGVYHLRSDGGRGCVRDSTVGLHSSLVPHSRAGNLQILERSGDLGQ